MHYPKQAIPARPHHRLKAVVTACVLAWSATALPALAQQASAAFNVERAYSLPAQPLGQALNDLARQAGVAISVDAALVAGKQAPAVAGQLTVRQALDRLLVGSGLAASVEGTSIVVRQAPPQRAGEVELSAVKVLADGSGSSNPSIEYLGRDTRAATGLPLSIKETPQSITVITEKRMEDQQLKTINAVLAQTTGISVKEYDSARQYYYARGFEVKNFMIDGVPVLFDPGWGTGEQDLGTAIYEQVEIIKGSAGLMAGSGDPSAAINLVRKRAKAKSLEGAASVGLGSRDSISGTVDVAGALNDNKTLRGRAVVSHEQEDSFRDVGDSARSLLYLTAEMDIADHTLLTIGGSYQDVENNGATWGGLPLWYDDGSRTNWSRSKTTAADWTYWDVVHQNLFIELDHKLSVDWQLKARINQGSSSGDSRLLYVYGAPNRVTGLGLTPWTGGKFTVDAEYYMADLTASGSFDLLGRRHDATLGVSTSQREFIAHSYNVTGTSPIGDFNAWNGTGYPLFTYGSRFLWEDYTDTQTAAYGSMRLNVSDRLKVVAGMRVTNYELDIAPGGVSISAGDNIKHDRVVTPYLGVLYDINETLTAYASYTDIFNTQGERDRNGNLLEPVVGKSYEVGVKSGFMNDRLIASAALFHIEQDNLAQADAGQFVPGTTDQAYVAADGAQSEGYELELVGMVSDGWDVQLGWTSYKAKDANGASVNTEQPRKLLKIFTTYRLPGALNKWTVGGGVTWEGKSYATATNAVTFLPERIEQEDYALVNFMTKYRVNDRMALQLNIDNLTDKTYYTNIGTFGQIAYGTPRTARLSIKYDF
ncbi:MAG: TonB-dependent siderophore receptor [Pseudomonadota bacterium]